jgi:gamma-glutamylcyclotransferase (GGCT)/AIG2-like uncharacterized protein YtfP
MGDVPLYGLNFAYGSNLDSAQRVRRCPLAVSEGPVLLRGFRLEFYGAADLEGDADGTVSALALRLSPEEERALDRCEGVDPASGRAPSYVKERVTAEREDGSTVEGYVYLMTPSRRTRDPRRPPDDYFERIVTGYRENNLDRTGLDAARART